MGGLAAARDEPLKGPPIPARRTGYYYEFFLAADSPRPESCGAATAGRRRGAQPLPPPTAPTNKHEAAALEDGAPHPFPLP